MAQIKQLLLELHSAQTDEQLIPRTDSLQKTSIISQVTNTNGSSASISSEATKLIPVAIVDEILMVLINYNIIFCII